MKRTIWRLSAFFQVLFVMCILGCNEQQIQTASGQYSVMVTNPQGKTEGGQANVAYAGEFVSIVIESDAGSFAFTGTFAGDEVKTTFKDSAGADATADFVFATGQGTLIGNIQTATGSYVVRGSHV